MENCDVPSTSQGSSKTVSANHDTAFRMKFTFDPRSEERKHLIITVLLDPTVAAGEARI